jgi:hypothetical protein
VKYLSNFAKQNLNVVVRINVNVVVDELLGQINNLHLFGDCYLYLTALTHINAVLCALVPSAQISGLSSEIGVNFFHFTMDTPNPPESA